jgi:TolB-like protein/Tfp pilus assembly protein PilF
MRSIAAAFSLSIRIPGSREDDLGVNMGPDPPVGSGDEQRLDSWKEIAAYLNRHVTTVRRWEKHEGLPVHRHLHEKLGSVYAFRTELNEWWRSRRVRLEQQDEPKARLEAPRCLSLSAFTGLALCLIAAAALIAAVATYALLPALSVRTDRPAIGSIGVLPLENLSGDAAQEYIAGGVTEALIGRLAQIRTLKVISRTSSMVFKGSRRPLPEIAAALGVDAIVYGSVQRSGDRIRIGVRLIDARTDTHVWAHDYERDSGDILRLQAELAEAVVREIRGQVTPEERARLASTVNVSAAAHQEYLIGRYHLWRDSDEHLQRAIAHFERATEIDPQYAAAFGRLAHAWWKRGLWTERLADTEAPARAAVEKALILDDSLPEAYVVQADLLRLYDRDLTGAEKLATRALTLQPNNVDAHYTYALVLMTAGRFDESIMHMKAAAELDPLAPAIQSDMGRALYRAGRYDEALVHLKRALELEPAMDWLVYRRLSEVCEQMGQYDSALLALGQADAGVSRNQTERRVLQARHARILALLGKRDEARRLIRDLEADPSVRVIRATAAANAALGENDRAFELLFREIDGGPGPNFTAVDPTFDILRSDSRWPELVRRLNVPRRTSRALTSDAR